MYTYTYYYLLPYEEILYYVNDMLRKENGDLIAKYGFQQIKSDLIANFNPEGKGKKLDYMTKEDWELVDNTLILIYTGILHFLGVEKGRMSLGQNAILAIFETSKDFQEVKQIIENILNEAREQMKKDNFKPNTAPKSYLKKQENYEYIMSGNMDDYISFCEDFSDNDCYKALYIYDKHLYLYIWPVEEINNIHNLVNADNLTLIDNNTKEKIMTKGQYFDDFNNIKKKYIDAIKAFEDSK